MIGLIRKKLKYIFSLKLKRMIRTTLIFSTLTKSDFIVIEMESKEGSWINFDKNVLKMWGDKITNVQTVELELPKAKHDSLKSQLGISKPNV